MIGVSPAYFISKFTSHFTINDYINETKWLSENNFTSLQLEIFHYEQIDQWTYNNIKNLKSTLNKNNLKASQFVAHFLMNCFEDSKSLNSDCGLDELKYLSTILQHFSLTVVLTVPLPPFIGTIDSREIISLDNKLKKCLKIVHDSGLKLALEPQPKSLGADLSYLDRLPEIGLNLDPGHILCSGIDPFSLEKNILSRVYATHLCENDGITNLSLAPGTFNNDWEKLINKLFKSGYSSSLDIEIICKSELVSEEYKKGNFFLNRNCIQNNKYI